MYFFFHLFTGIIVGLFTGDIFKDNRWVLPCAFGAILPDLIDKPLGHLIFSESIGYGRIYGHCLLFFLLVFFIGLILWRTCKSPFILAMAAGIFSHQVLDLMWHEPINWFFPLFGPFFGHLPQDYLLVLLVRELNNPFEILIALILGLCILLYAKRDQIIGQKSTCRSILSGSLLLVALVLFVLSGIIIGLGIMGRLLPFTGWSQREEFIIGGIVLLLASCVMWRWHLKMKRGNNH